MPKSWTTQKRGGLLLVLISETDAVDQRVYRISNNSKSVLETEEGFVPNSNRQ